MRVVKVKDYIKSLEVHYYDGEFITDVTPRLVDSHNRLLALVSAIFKDDNPNIEVYDEPQTDPTA